MRRSVYMRGQRPVRLSHYYLSIDPGALRAGFAYARKDSLGYHLMQSGVHGLERKEDEKFQDYRLRLIDYWRTMSRLLLTPDVSHLIIETLPGVGSGNFIAATQSELCKNVSTLLIAAAMDKSIPVTQQAANSMHKAVTGKASTRKKKVTKTAVRNAVLEIWPELGKEREWDEYDACAHALTALGYRKKASK